MIQSVLGGECHPAHAGSEGCTHRNYLLVGQFRQIGSLATTRAALLDHVIHVGQMISQKEMVRPNAAPHIAVVKYPSSRPVAVVQKPRDVGSRKGFAMYAETAVAGGQQARGPKPAPSGQIADDLHPEPLRERQPRVNSAWHRSFTPFGVQAPGCFQHRGGQVLPIVRTPQEVE